MHYIPNMRTSAMDICYLIFIAAILEEYGENNVCPNFWLHVSVA